jgi:hypothetical protein
MADISDIFPDKAQAVYISNMHEDITLLQKSIIDIKNLIIGMLLAYLGTLTAATITIIIFILSKG